MKINEELPSHNILEEQEDFALASYDTLSKNSENSRQSSFSSDNSSSFEQL